MLNTTSISSLIFSILFLLASSLGAASLAFAKTEVQIYSPYIHKYSAKSGILADSIPSSYLAIKNEEVRYFPEGEQMTTLLQSFILLEAIVNSKTFKKQVIGHIDSWDQRSYTSNNGLTNEQIYLKLMEGRELLTPDTPGEANIFIEKYYKRSGTIGFTYPGDHKWIYINWRHYAGFNVSEMASNIFHEWIHLMGFYHSSSRDYDSVPYAIGTIVENLARIYLRQGFIE